MAIYTESAVQYNGVQKESIEDVINDDRVVPSESDDFISEGMEVILGMTENYNMVMEHVGRSELLALEQTGEQLVYTEGVIGSIFSTIKKFLSKIWEKIKSLFKRFIMMIDSYTKNDKAFVNKYRQQIYRHKSLSDFTFKGYVYTIDTGKIDNMMKMLQDKSKEYRRYAEKNPSNSGTITSQKLQKDIDKLDDLIEEARGDILSAYPKGKKGKFTSEEFRKEFKELLRNGESEKQDLDGSNSNEIDVDGMVTELQNYRETKKTIDTAFKGSKKAIDEDNKSIDHIQKEWMNDRTPENLSGTGDDDYEITTGQTKHNKIINYDTGEEKDVNSFVGEIRSTFRNIDWDKIGDKEEVIKRLLGGETLQLPYISSGHIDTTLKGTGMEKYANGYWHFETHVSPNKSTKQTEKKELSDRKGKHIQIAFRVINQTKQCLVDIDTIVLQTLKERSRQYKACLVKIVYHNPKNEEAYNESYSYHNQFQQNFTSPLSNIEFK